VETGRFLTVLPGCTLKLPRKHPSLRALPVEFPNIRHQIAVLTLKGRSLSPLAQVFIERVRALVQPLSAAERRHVSPGSNLTTKDQSLPPPVLPRCPHWVSFAAG